MTLTPERPETAGAPPPDPAPPRADPQDAEGVRGEVSEDDVAAWVARQMAAGDAAPDAVTPDAIRERAYDLWERHHRPEGYEIEFWIMAERELWAERRRAAPGAPPQAPRGRP